jgi:hypothetical protein
MPAPARKSPMRMQGPPYALPTPCQIYASFASIIRCLAGWDAGTKGTVQKDDASPTRTRGPQATRDEKSILVGANRAASLGLVTFPHWDGVYCLVTGPPSLLCAQNLESKRFTFRPCARSLSLQELQAKSREHGSYGGNSEVRSSVSERAGPGSRHRTRSGSAPFAQVRAGPGCAAARIRLSKIERYRIDNAAHY